MKFYAVARGIVSGILHLMYRIKIEGKENVPTDKPFLLCANHISLMDPPMLGTCLSVPLRYMAKEELFKNKVFGSLLRAVGAFPIRRGKSDVGALRTAMKLLQGGENLVIFPEGGRSKTPGVLRKGKSGAALIAHKAGVDILPVGIQGSYKLFRKMTIRIGAPLSLDLGEKVDSEALQGFTDEKIMSAIAALAEVKTYESIHS